MTGRLKTRVPLLSTMHLYACFRWDENPVEGGEWMGALLIYAKSEDDARVIFKKREGDEPGRISELPLEHGIIYDDDAR